MPDPADSGQEPQTDQTQRDGSGDTSDDGQEPRTYSADYVKRLRAENANHRTRASTAENRLKVLETAQLTEAEQWQRAAQEATGQLSAVQTELRQVRAEAAIVSAASEAKAKAPARIARLIAPADVEWDEQGRPTNIAKLVRALQQEAPELFFATNGSADGGNGRAAASVDMNTLIRQAAGRA